MKPWWGSLFQWSNGPLIHGMSGLHGTISGERLRYFCYTAQREGFRGERADRNGCCSVCYVLYAFYFAWEYFVCMGIFICMSLNTYTHLLVFKCTFSLWQHRQVEGNTGQPQLTSVISHLEFHVHLYKVGNCRGLIVTLFKVLLQQINADMHVTYLFYWCIHLYVREMFWVFLRGETKTKNCQKILFCSNNTEGTSSLNNQAKIEFKYFFFHKATWNLKTTTNDASFSSLENICCVCNIGTHLLLVSLLQTKRVTENTQIKEKVEQIVQFQGIWVSNFEERPGKMPLDEGENLRWKITGDDVKNCTKKISSMKTTRMSCCCGTEWEEQGTQDWLGIQE